MGNPNFTVRQINLGDKVIDQVSSYKILGVHLQNDPKWDIHIDYIYKKACERLYSLRILRQAGVDQESILKVYLSTIRPVMEFAVPVWQLIPSTLADKLETVQKRAVRIIFPSIESYNEALERAHLDSLATRRHFFCLQYIDKIKVKGHPLHNPLSKRISADCLNGLRNKQDNV